LGLTYTGWCSCSRWCHGVTISGWSAALV
jgi:hypothetical protein